MQICPGQVNLSENDIENHLFANPELVNTEFVRVTRWLKRQYHVPSGVIDLLGVTDGDGIAVVEIKSVEITGDAVLQVKRYAFDIDEVLRAEGVRTLCCMPILIGPSIRDQVLLDCEACGVVVLLYQPRVSLAIRRKDWSDDFLSSRAAQYARVANDPIIAAQISNAFGDSVGTSWIDYMKRTHNHERP